ncbi:MAG: hypothetical protein L6R40_001133 [Gallowayella cf. fulva]|nr:MAG: hypothetical protein L6R40_001133 [Xanthomendoza cf. fulva]
MVSWLFWAKSSDSIEPPAPKRQTQSSSMSQHSNKPNLTPQFCFNETALRGTDCLMTRTYRTFPANFLYPSADFLRLSRGTIDDSIIQNLNALVTPAREGFNPSSTAERQVEPTRKKPIDPQACQGFKENLPWILTIRTLLCEKPSRRKIVNESSMRG